MAGPNGLIRFVLPEYQRDDLCDLLAWEHAGARRDDNAFGRVVELTRDYFNGKAVDFTEIACDLPAENTFAGMVLRACRTIPYGQTRSYLSLAEQINRPDAARAVATTLGKNNIPLIIPCHRVIYSDGRIGGYSAPGGPEMKKRLLDLEKS